MSADKKTDKEIFEDKLNSLKDFYSNLALECKTSREKKICFKAMFVWHGEFVKTMSETFNKIIPKVAN